jgi:hypothetical protein
VNFGGVLSVLQDQRHLRTGRHSVTSHLRVLRRNLVFFEGGVARIVDRENFGVNRIALGVTNALRSLDMDLHKAILKDVWDMVAPFGAR